MIINSSLLAKAFGVKGVKFKDIEQVSVTTKRKKRAFTQERVFIEVEPYERLKKRCPICERSCPTYDNHKTEAPLWRAKSMGDLPTYFVYRPVRIQCPEHGVHTEKVPWSDGDTRSLASFNDEVTYLALHTPRTVVCEVMGIDWKTVGNCITATHNRLEPDVSQRLNGLRQICMDETSYKNGKKYITVVLDMVKNRVVWIHEGRGNGVIKEFCEALSPEVRNQIEVIAGDGADWIDYAKDNYLPNAVRCIDPYHVVAWVNEAMDSVRIRLSSEATREFNEAKKAAEKREKEAQKAWLEEYKKYQEAVSKVESLKHKKGRRSKEEHELITFVSDFESKYGGAANTQSSERKAGVSDEEKEVLKSLEKRFKDIKGSKYAFIMNPENLSEYNAERLELIKVSNPELYRAYQLKEEVRVIIHMKDPDLAEKELNKWISTAKDSGFPEFRRLAEKISRHTEGILNSVKTGANSSLSEQTNGIIQSIINSAHGFRNLGNLFSLIYLRCSDLVVPLRNRYQLTAEEKQAIRARAKALRQAREEEKRRKLEGSDNP